jgi:hypothetical protein
MDGLTVWRRSEDGASRRAFGSGRRSGRVGRGIAWRIGGALLALLSISAGADDIRIEGVPDQTVFTFDLASATDLSGITWAGGSDYYAVSDKVRGVLPLRIEVDPTTGRIGEVRPGRMIPIKTDFADFEGVVFAGARKQMYISPEQAGVVIGFSLGRGSVSQFPIPSVFARARRNKGIESLTCEASSATFWVANEEALEGDGPVSGSDAGTVVRLQKFDRRFRPLVQYAYRTEPSRFRVNGAGTGVSELAALPTGDLLVLERVVNRTGLAAKIFRFTTQGATDISRIPHLDGAEFRPAGKKLLFERAALIMNFEGMTLGPAIADGWRSLLLIADSGGATTHNLMPLRIRWDARR